LAQALQTLGIKNYQFQSQTGILTISGRNATADLVAKVKVAYSQQVVFSQAKTYGWQMKPVGENKWVVQRR
jgi:hypothetical protein